jgi:hypothetical protein
LELIEGCIKVCDDLAKLLEPAQSKELGKLKPGLAAKIRLVVTRKEELKSLAAFLKHFQYAVETLEVIEILMPQLITPFQTNEVSLDLVLTQCRKLDHILRFLSNSPDEYSSQLACLGLKVFEEKIVKQSFLRPEHFMAVLLKPSSKKFTAKLQLSDGSKVRWFDEDDRNKVIFNLLQ